MPTKLKTPAMKNILPTNDIQTTIFRINSREVKVHAVQTGLISVKENFLNKKGDGVMNKLNIVFGKTYADFMPIWVWVIEHPEGIIVVDTGDIEASLHKEFYKNESTGARLTLSAMGNKRHISKQDELDAQLARLGVTP